MSISNTDAQYIWHPLTQHKTSVAPLPILKAKGAILYGEDGRVKGIATRDMGINKDGSAKSTFARGMELRARMVLLFCNIFTS